MAVIILYAATAILALQWWMVLDDKPSLWGKPIASVTPHVRLHFEPVVVALAAAFLPALVAALSSSKLVQAAQLVLALYLLDAAIRYHLHGSYFGCDRNACTAEEQYDLTTILGAMASILLAGIAKIGSMASRALCGLAMRHLGS